MNARFSDVVFNANARTITRGGAPVHLSPKAFDLLSMLIDARPRVVTKNEMLDRLWPDVVVEEANIRNLVAEVRDAIGDGEEQCIRTVPRVGYAFSAELEPQRGESGCLLFAADREFALVEGANVIGRADECEVVLRFDGVSRAHARLTVSRDTARIEDLGSKNGTFVNGTRIDAPVALHDRDRIVIGSMLLTFRTGVATATTITSSIRLTR